MTVISSLIPPILQAIRLGALRYYPQSEILHLPHPGHPPLLLHCPVEVGAGGKSDEIRKW